MSILPKNERRAIAAPTDQGLRLWLYAAPYVGKTTFADQFPDPINLNTDGNIKFVSMPYVTISPDNSANVSAWTFFKQTVDELLKGKHGYKTIVVDLLEDIYQHCRDHHNAAQGWVHESEPGYAKGYDLIRNDFLGELKRLATSGYNVVFLSHQVDKSVKSRTGRETTIFLPNLSEKVAIKVSGLVDITARAFMDVREEADGSSTDVRLIQMKPTANEFNSGGRVETDEAQVELNYEAFKAALKVKSLSGSKKKPTHTVEADPEEPQKRTRVRKEEPVEEVVEIEEEVLVETEEPIEEEPAPRARVRRARRTAPAEEVGEVGEEVVEEEPAPAPARRQRRTRQLT